VSRDAALQRWSTAMSLQLPAGFSAWNTDVTRAVFNDTDAWVMAIELQAPSKLVGVPFSTAFAVCAGCGTDLARGWVPPRDLIGTPRNHS
jgi:hypothetical protein